MEKRKLKIIVLSLFLLFYGQTALGAAWTGEENFDALSDGTGVDGTSGGEGWTTSWSETPSAGDTYEGDTAVKEGTASAMLELSGSNESYITRDFSTNNASVFYFSYRQNTSDANLVQYVNLQTTGGTTRAYIKIYQGNVAVFDTSIYNVECSGLGTGVWHRIGVDYDTTQGTKVNCDGGSWSSYRAMSNSGDIGRIKLQTSGDSGHVGWFDSVGADAEAPATETEETAGAIVYQEYGGYTLSSIDPLQFVFFLALFGSFYLIIMLILVWVYRELSKW